MTTQRFEPLESRRLLFAYDGFIDAGDYGIIDSNVQAQSIPFPISGGTSVDANATPVSPTDFSGSARNDVITVSAAADGAVTVRVNGMTTTTSGGKLNLSGNAGNDKIHVDLPDTYAHWLITIHGGDGDDVIVGSMAGERIIAGDGNDYILANGGRDTVYAEGGDDFVRGGGSSDLLDGGEGNDTIRGDGGNDRISGAGGIDRLRGSVGNDTLDGGASRDFISGEVGNDNLIGGGGNDALSGGENDDRLDGGAGADHCSGNAGNDLLAGGSGVDSLFGGPGKDTCATGDDLNERRDTDAEDLAPASGGGTIDLNDNRLNIGGGAQGDVQRAYDFGAWNQAGLMTSMPEALGGLTTIGIATGAQIRGLETNASEVWGGQTITGGSTLAMYTYAGDANLDGQIDADDYGIIDNFVQISGSTGFANGDFNYDGFIDAGDYGMIDNAAQAQGLPS